ncbi:MAG: hypothetical protein LBP61_06740 [Desulfovibrio sp.]|jgi:hypothetical protein|nr:hypothetical protein [Desulfovibrio sp.]
MQRPLCLLHANCHGEELQALLNASPAFRRAYRLEYYVNYAKQAIPAESLEECALFLYQHLDSQWGDLASEALLRRLPASAGSLKLPNPFFNGYWPLWTGDGPIAFGDILLNRLIDEGASKRAILTVYLRRDLSSFVDLQAVLDGCIARERSKEQGACVALADWTLERWKERPLFHTVNHPGRELLLRIAQAVLAHLGFSPMGDEALAHLPAPFPSYASFDLPIHPQVAAFHGLGFIAPDQRYTIFQRRMTFEQYISRYIDCRLNGCAADFLGYLQLV